MELPGYTDLEEIGRGGFGVVYRARQSSVDRVVAIKVLNQVALNSAGQSRFERECRAMGSLSWHPNIVVVHEAGTTPEGVPFLAMEFFEQGSLADRLERGPVPPAHVAEYGIELTAALGAAHDAGVLHRDLKPGNILIDRLGHAKLGDFGIASFSTGPQTATGIVTASIVHAPPEVLEGKRANERSDIYSLGSTLYELLTGLPAFVRVTDETMLPVLTRTLSQPAPDLRLRGVPDRLASVIEIAMAKDPAERFQSAMAMRNALQVAATTAEVTSATEALPAPERAVDERVSSATIVRPVTPAAPTIAAPSAEPADVAPEAVPPAAAAREPTEAPATNLSETISTPLPPPLPPVPAEPPTGDVPAEPEAAASSPLDPEPGAKRKRWPLVVGGLVLLAVVVALIVVVTGGSGSRGGGGTGDEAESVVIGSVVDVSLVEGESRTFAITGTDAAVGIAVSPVGDFDPTITLRDPQGDDIDFNDDITLGESTARIEPFLDIDQVYEIEVKGFEGAAGDFQLTIEAVG